MFPLYSLQLSFLLYLALGWQRIIPPEPRDFGP